MIEREHLIDAESDGKELIQQGTSLVEAVTAAEVYFRQHIPNSVIHNQMLDTLKLCGIPPEVSP